MCLSHREITSEIFQYLSWLLFSAEKRVSRLHVMNILNIDDTCNVAS